MYLSPLLLTQMGADNFSATANPLNPALWTIAPSQGTTYGALQASSGLCQATNVAGSLCFEFYTAVPTPDAQYLTATIAFLDLTTTGEMDLCARVGGPDNDNLVYFALIANGDGSTADLSVGVQYGVIQTGQDPLVDQLYDNPSLAVKNGDTLLLAVMQTTVFAFYNSVLIYSGSDPNIPLTGSLGPDIETSSYETEAAWSNFSMGSVAIPSPPKRSGPVYGSGRSASFGVTG